MRLLYTFSIHLYTLFAKCLSLWNKKAGLWAAGRKNLIPTIQSQLNGNEEIIWFHCASLGEFEQGRPLMELFKTKQPNVKILLTFFSPSGYEIRKNYAGADYIFYLPTDTPKHAKQFLDIVNPKCIFFVKYEFWYNYIRQAYERKIPFYSVACVFRPQQFYFSWYGKWFAEQLAKVTHFFTQDQASADLLRTINITQSTVCGDTRFDRVCQIVKNANGIPFFANYCQNDFTIVAGSTWLPDEKILSALMYIHHFQLIIAPHEIHEDHIASVEKLFSDFSPIRFSQIVKKNIKQAENKVIIIDSIGLLSALYRYGNIAYVGGGFGAGIHNILEAATYGKPIVFGPNYQKFKEAADLIQLQGAFSGKNFAEINNIFSSILLFFLYSNNPNEAGNKALQYVEKNVGATEKIYNSIIFGFKD
jgi:3-deoxy-D-manno-octulosonic-acid transferase